jgi:hypothetical protein
VVKSCERLDHPTSANMYKLTVYCNQLAMSTGKTPR